MVEFMNGFEGSAVLDWITAVCFVGLPVFIIFWCLNALDSGDEKSEKK